MSCVSPPEAPGVSSVPPDGLHLDGGVRQRLQLIADTAFEAMVITEGDTLVAWNAAATDLFGYAPDVLRTFPRYHVVAEKDHAKVAASEASSESGPYEIELMHPARGPLPVAVRARSMTVHGRCFRVVALRDMSASRRLEQESAGHAHQLASVFRVAPTAIGVVVHRVFVEVNECMCTMTGYTREELIGQSAQMLYPDVAEFDRVGKLKYDDIRRAGTGTIETRWRRKDGGILDVILSSSPIEPEDWSVGVTFTALDVTHRRQAERDQRRLEAQLVQAQKLESVGRLASGVAHDFNNMLLAIQGYADLARRAAPDQPELHEHLAEVEDAARRSADLTRQLLAFSRRQAADPREINLNDTIDGMLKMLRRLIGEDIQLEWKPGAGVGVIRIDPSHIDQVLANLVVNARDAIVGVGRVRIETGECQVDAGAGQPGRQPGSYVRLSVIDTGCGMDDETRQRVFEPFFTTKPQGKGTGLGLSTVYGIVAQNGGFIDVQSEPGAGTTMSICLPRSAGTVVPEVHPVEPSPLAGGSETILLVEDEDLVLRLVGSALVNCGYTVLSASRPDDALRIVRRYAGPIDLLLTDVVMPGMNGCDLRAQIAELRPGLPCIYMTGYGAGVPALQTELERRVPLLRKPFPIKALAQQVREVLDTAATIGH